MSESNLPQITRDAVGAPIPDFAGVELPGDLHVEVVQILEALSPGRRGNRGRQQGEASENWRHCMHSSHFGGCEAMAVPSRD